MEINGIPAALTISFLQPVAKTRLAQTQEEGV
jgi:hypothetical protein